MYNFKYQGLAKLLFCFCISFSLDAISADSLDIEGPNLILPRKPSRPKQDWVDKEPRGQTCKENLLVLAQKKSYVTLHNEMARKYGLTQHIIHPRAAAEESTLATEAENFKIACESLKKKEEERNAEINAIGQATVHEGKAIVETLISNYVQEEKAKSILTQFTDRCADFVRGLFSN
jgi:hypothetical protein